MTFVSCNFEDAEEATSGGGLFKDHKEVENTFLITYPANGTYVEGETLDFTLIHPYQISVTGTPRLSIDIGGNLVTANYLTGDGTKNLTFRYTVVANDEDLDGIEVDNTIDLNSGTLKFSNSGTITDANTSFIELTNSNGVKVDTVSPLISLVTPPTPKTYYLNETLKHKNMCKTS